MNQIISILQSFNLKWNIFPQHNELFRTMILSRRPKDDDNKDGFTNWPFMTTHTWGENPRGKWRLIARFQVNYCI